MGITSITNNDKELINACKQFETYFLHNIMKEIRKTVSSENGALSKSGVQNIFQEMLDLEICKSVSKNGGIGLAEKMHEQISKETAF